MRYHVVLPAAGTGSRFGASTPKQYLDLLGKPILQHTLDRLARYFPSAMMYVAISPEDRWFEQLISVFDRVIVLRCGGATRAQSVRNALRLLSDAAPDDWVLVHDAVRPCIDRAACDRLVSGLNDHPVGGLLATRVTDTLKRVDISEHVQCTESRDTFWRAQTPQMFRYAVLERALSIAEEATWTDEAHAVEALGLQPRVIVGAASNIKVTLPEDLALAAAILTTERGDHP